ncbi:recombinase [Erwinia endophytica]|uniref:tyrosine-type recombinase/integrase n=1 Tax=Erwinia endophytica TaxID=1563158 RepID=UPI001265F9DC|nr:recombinase [Erwinia endophytica]KAB8312259.1 recombinase [Erwinia endophytica]
MSPRPRKKEYRNLPEYLGYDKSKGVYRLTLITGKRADMGKDRAIAIAIAREYNYQMRPESRISINSLIRASGGISGEALPFSEHADHLLQRAIKEEQPATDTLDKWNNDIERVKKYFTMPACDIELEHVNGYINEYHAEASANVQNRKIAFLSKLFSYAVDESLMFDNPATRKKKKRVEGKTRRRLTLPDFNKIHAIAEPFLRTAMDLALQTTQARLEVSRILYNIPCPKNGVCGCVWFEQPANGIYGTLFIHRQKVQHKEASHVAIPIGPELKRIIDESRDNVASPYVVHRIRDRNNKLSKEVNHPTQVAPDYLSRSFSETRDLAGVAAHLPEKERPTFHEIRALAAHLFSVQGINPQARMAHSDAKSTQIYTENHLEWIAVPHAEIKAG